MRFLERRKGKVEMGGGKSARNESSGHFLDPAFCVLGDRHSLGVVVSLLEFSEIHSGVTISLLAKKGC